MKNFDPFFLCDKVAKQIGHNIVNHKLAWFLLLNNPVRPGSPSLWNHIINPLKILNGPWISKKTWRKPEIIKGKEPLSKSNKIIFLNFEEYKYGLNAHMQKNDGSQLKRLTQFK